MIKLRTKDILILITGRVFSENGFSDVKGVYARLFQTSIEDIEKNWDDITAHNMWKQKAEDIVFKHVPWAQDVYDDYIKMSKVACMDNLDVAEVFANQCLMKYGLTQDIPIDEKVPQSNVKRRVHKTSRSFQPC